MTRDELEQRLWELEYGLLPDSEAVELRRQLAADKHLAAQHRQVLDRLQLVSRAAKIEQPGLVLRAPSDETAIPSVATSPSRSAGESTATDNPFRTGRGTPDRIWRRVANWGTALAASWLVATIAWTAWPERNRDLAEGSPANLPIQASPRLAEEPQVFISVAVPQQVNRDAQVPLAIQTRKLDGSPHSVDLEANVRFGTGEPIHAVKLRTDALGRGYLNVTPESLNAAEPTILSFYRQQSPAVEVTLPPAREEYVTRLATDKPRYRPGDMVRFRSVTLSRFGLRVDREFSTEHFVTDPQGDELAGTRQTTATEQGVSAADFALPQDARPGRYSLFFRSPEESFPEARTHFDVVAARERRFDASVAWFKPAFAPNETIQGELKLKSRGNSSVAAVPVQVQAFIDGRELPTTKPDLATNAEGSAEVRFTAPAPVASATGELGVRIQDQETLWFDIPLQPDQVVVDFYPEGGDLCAGVVNRVYFHSHDADGRPVTLTAMLVDSANRDVSEVQTIRDGRGVFSFQPAADETYSLRVITPTGIASHPQLPPVVPSSPLVLNAGAGVFAPDEPLRLELRGESLPANFAYSIVARCRGVTVGQLSGAGSDFQDRVCPIELPVIPETSGVVRVTVFDHSGPEPQPLAERLVYRRPARQLRIDFSDWPARLSPEEPMKGTVVTSDEAGNPISAVLGISVVDVGVLNTAPSPPARLPTQFQLLGDLDNAEELEDANFYLSDDPEATVALDLLLGTQGWRRFDRVPVSRLALNVGQNVDGYAAGVDLGGLGAERNSRYFNAPGGSAGMSGAKLPFNETVEEALQNQRGTSDFAIQSLRDATDDAPLLTDNRRSLADSFRTNAELGFQMMEQERAPARAVSPERSRAATRHSSLVGWALAGGLVALVVTLVLRWRPRASTLVASLATAGSLLAFAWLFIALNEPGQPVASSATNGEPGALTVGEPDSALHTEAQVPPESEFRAARPAAPASSVSEQKLTEVESAPLPDRQSGGALPPQPPALPAADITDIAPPSPVPAPAAMPAPAPASPARAAAIPAPGQAVPAPAPATPPADPAPAFGAQAMPRRAAQDGVGTPPASRKLAEEVDLPIERELAKKQVFLRDNASDAIKSEAWRMRSGPAPKVKSSSTSESNATPKPDPKEQSRGNVAVTLDLPQLQGHQELRQQVPTQASSQPRGAAIARPKKPDLDGKAVVRFYARQAKPTEQTLSTNLKSTDTELLYWHPLLITDSDGKATIEFAPPSVRTPYQVLIDGHQQGRVGSATRTLEP